MRILTAGVALTALVCATTGAWSQQLQKVSIGQSSSSIPAAGPKIAKELGLFEKHGLDANVTAMDTASVAIAALISGSIDISSSGPTDVINANVRGQDLVALCTVYRGYPGVMVLGKSVVEKLGVSPDAPVAQRAKALNGLLIASSSASSIYTYAPKPLAEANGATIRFTYMAQPAMVAALESGAVQGYVSGAPYYTAAVVKGLGVIWLNGPKGDFPDAYTPANAVTLITLRSNVKKNPDVYKRACAVFGDLAKAVKERPDDVKAAIAKIYPDLDRKTIDVLFETDSLGFLTKPLTKEDMAREIAFLKASGTDVPSTIDPASLLLAP